MDNKQPKVTVMVANYNGADYLEACLQSINAQTFTDYEILLIDDGSTDNSREIYGGFLEKNKKLRVMELGTNHGLTYVRHVGLSEAKGEYVAILDADDVALPQRLQRQVAYLEHHKEVVLLGSYYGIINSDGKIHRAKKRVPLRDAEIRWRMTLGNCFIHSTVMYRRSAAQRCGGYNREILRGEDMELSSKIITLGKAAAIPQVLAYWRRHPASMTRSINNAEMEKYYFRIIRYAIQVNSGQKVDLDVAAAAFYNAHTPANNARVFKQALGVALNIFRQYSQNLSRPEQRLLNRSFLMYLFKQRKLNKKQIWWPGQAKVLEQYFLFLIKEQSYHWYCDSSLFFSSNGLTVKQFFVLLFLSIKSFKSL